MVIWPSQFRLRSLSHYPVTESIAGNPRSLHQPMKPRATLAEAEVKLQVPFGE